AMWLAGFSIDNLSLMALAVSVGFVVDDAIVMIENAFRHLEHGASPLRASLKGAKQIGFTVVSISVSLIAAFIPLLFMGGVVGRLVPYILGDARVSLYLFPRSVAIGPPDDLCLFCASPAEPGRYLARSSG